VHANGRSFLKARGFPWYTNRGEREEELMPKKVHKDPVCRKWLAKETKNKVEKDGKAVFFCSPQCKEKFEKSADKYEKLVG
jgi:YHS domain-containing protein